jgi:histidine triad (HIT) family protein
MGETIFSKIIARKIPATIVYEDDRAVAFRDIQPQAPVHLLIVPRKEIAEVGNAQPDDAALLGHLLLVAAQLARREGLAESGYRLVINNGADAGQAVPHLHVHLLGGRALGWPPG